MLSALLPRIPPHLHFYEDVSRHPSDHLLLSGYTPLFWKTKDFPTESSWDEELTFAGVTGKPLRGQPNPSCPDECRLKQVSARDRLPLAACSWRFATVGAMRCFTASTFSFWLNRIHIHHQYMINDICQLWWDKPRHWQWAYPQKQTLLMHKCTLLLLKSDIHIVMSFYSQDLFKGHYFWVVWTILLCSQCLRMASYLDCEAERGPEVPLNSSWVHSFVGPMLNQIV